MQCAADKQPAPDAHRDLVTLHLFFFYSMHYIFLAFLNPPFLLPHKSQHHDTDVGSTRLTSLLYDGPRATEGSYFAAARTGDWRHWLELTVVTRCKLWTTQTCHSLSGDLLNYDQMRNLTKCILRTDWIIDIKSVFYVIKLFYNTCMTQELVFELYTFW